MLGTTQGTDAANMNQLNTVSRIAYSGIAMSFAMSGAVMPNLEPGEKAFGVGVGGYKGFGAIAFNFKSLNGSGDSVLRAAATRALTAVARAAPYDELPSEDFANWRSFVVAFDARQQCRGY